MWCGWAWRWAVGVTYRPMWRGTPEYDVLMVRLLSLFLVVTGVMPVKVQATVADRCGRPMYDVVAGALKSTCWLCGGCQFVVDDGGGGGMLLMGAERAVRMLLCEIYSYVTGFEHGAQPGSGTTTMMNHRRHRRSLVRRCGATVRCQRCDGMGTECYSSVQWNKLINRELFSAHCFLSCTSYCIDVRRLNCMYSVKQEITRGVALTWRNRTGPPCSVGCPTVHAPGGRPHDGTVADDRRRRQTSACKTILTH